MSYCDVYPATGRRKAAFAAFDAPMRRGDVGDRRKFNTTVRYERRNKTTPAQLQHIAAGVAFEHNPNPDKVWTENCPDYYDLAGHNIIELIGKAHLDFNQGCAMKYLTRAGRKPGVSLLQDLRKARVAIDHAITCAE